MSVTLARFQEIAVGHGLDKRTVQEFVFDWIDKHFKNPSDYQNLLEVSDWQAKFDAYVASAPSKRKTA